MVKKQTVYMVKKSHWKPGILKMDIIEDDIFNTRLVNLEILTV